MRSESEEWDELHAYLDEHELSEEELKAIRLEELQKLGLVGPTGCPTGPQGVEGPPGFTEPLGKIYASIQADPAYQELARKVQEAFDKTVKSCSNRFWASNKSYSFRVDLPQSQAEDDFWKRNDP